MLPVACQAQFLPVAAQRLWVSSGVALQRGLIAAAATQHSLLNQHADVSQLCSTSAPLLLGAAPRSPAWQPWRAFQSSCSPLHSAGKQQQQHSSKERWQALIRRVPDGELNPCNSPLHPAVIEGIIEPKGEELCVQDAYTPGSTCFGCGPANTEGLQLKSKRIRNGLEAIITIPSKFCAFPGIVNGGIVSTLLECHGNWTAAIALMDKACLPRPPLTLTASMLVTYKEPTPPDTRLLLRSEVTSVKESSQPGIGKASVEVQTSVYLITNSSPHVRVLEGLDANEEPGEEHLQLLAVSQGVHKRMGALRAL